ncbi:hypothetical protein RHRU231_210046 [Rhodococcus ruber]|uniref:Uncharacterized protein n=1 Tax=Rhodococcus ruber TaxID=1830 RepID=A0A098BFU3_9NOCA|nr:hypothetical protein RHRU231_210046 [Rhodococcus ruber]
MQAYQHSPCQIRSLHLDQDGSITFFSSTTPTEVSSASNTRARRIIEAGCTPVVVNRSKNARSAELNVTGRFFCEGMTTVLTGRGKGKSAAPTVTKQDRTKQRHAPSRRCGRIEEPVHAAVTYLE